MPFYKRFGSGVIFPPFWVRFSFSSWAPREPYVKMNPTHDSLIVIIFLYLRHISALLPRELLTEGSMFVIYWCLVHRGHIKVFAKLK